MAKSKRKSTDAQKRVLLLSCNYEVLNFVSDVRAILMLTREKVDVISHWDDHTFNTPNVKLPIPSIIRLRSPIRRKHGPVRYHRIVVFRRDGWRCQYCGVTVSKRDATIDHVNPQCKGGRTNYKNCVTACRACNHKKAFKTPEEVGMALMSKLEMPNVLHLYNIDVRHGWHPSWDDFIGHLKST